MTEDAMSVAELAREVRELVAEARTEVGSCARAEVARRTAPTTRKCGLIQLPCSLNPCPQRSDSPEAFAVEENALIVKVETSVDSGG
jgi:hypothetical protein